MWINRKLWDEFKRVEREQNVRIHKLELNQEYGKWINPVKDFTYADSDSLSGGGLAKLYCVVSNPVVGGKGAGIRVNESLTLNEATIISDHKNGSPWPARHYTVERMP